MKKIILLAIILILISGCAFQTTFGGRTAQEYQNPRAEDSYELVEYVTYDHEFFTLTYPDEWEEPQHYTRDYYYFQLLDFYPYVHLSVFDLENVTSLEDFYESYTEILYIMYDFEEIKSQITEDEAYLRGIMTQDEDITIMTAKIIVCPDIVLFLDVSVFEEDFAELEEDINSVVDSFECN
jgi:hypothetical protein